MQATFKRGVVYFSVLSLITSQLSGCASLPALPAGLRSVIEDGTAYHKGKPSQAVYQNSLAGKAIFEKIEAGPLAMGYRTNEFKQLYQQFTDAKQAMARADGNFTQSQFLELYSSITGVLSYMDTVEGLKKKGARVGKYSSNRDAYTILPGERMKFDIDGFCLDKSLPAASAGEPFRLEPLGQFISDPMIPTYQNVIKLHQDKPARSQLPSYRYDPDSQALMWALRGLKTGEIDRRMLNNMPERQKAVLQGTDPAAYSRMMTNAKAKEVVRGFSDAFDQSIFGQGYAALQDLTGGDPDVFLNDPGVMNDSRRLESAMEQWQQRQQAASKKIVPSPHSSPYTLLDDGVAARAVATNQLRTNVEVVNLSGEPFVFKPADYVFNSRSKSQAVAPGRWSQVEGNQLAYQDGGDTDDVTEMLRQDFVELSTLKGLESLSPARGSIGRALAGMGDVFSSKAVTGLLHAAPVVSNIISLGMLTTGKNLDGSDMGTADYIMAGIGVVPVVGNVARLLRPAGSSVFARELRTIDRFYERYDKPLLVADVLTTDTAEYYIEQSGAPAWFQSATQKATSSVLGAIKTEMPETAQFIKTNAVAL